MSVEQLGREIDRAAAEPVATRDGLNSALC